MVRKLKTNILVILGSLFLIIGAIGIFIPLLPTTPFLLLAAYCYIRSSKKLYDWLMGNKVLGNYIHNYFEHKAISIRAKISTMVILWVGLSVSMLLLDNWWIRALLIAVGIGVSIHVLTIKTLKSTGGSE